MRQVGWVIHVKLSVGPLTTLLLQQILISPLDDAGTHDELKLVTTSLIWLPGCLTIRISLVCSGRERRMKNPFKIHSSIRLNRPASWVYKINQQHRRLDIRALLSDLSFDSFYQLFYIYPASTSLAHNIAMSLKTLSAFLTTVLAATGTVTAFNAALFTDTSGNGSAPMTPGFNFSDYPFMAPGPNDLRSPCPGLKYVNQFSSLHLLMHC